jgi:hypothetical protein
VAEQRKVQTGCRYEEAKAASASAADRISQATESLIGTLRQAFAPEYNQPRETPVKLIHNTASE